MVKISIVIPTRNRAHLLKYAIASALRQTYQNVEIIVSDNYSIDDTKSVVDSFKQPRIRYVRTDEPLDMPRSWNFAFRHANGEYITYLTDDSYLLSDSVEKALSKIEMFNVKLAVWNLCTYFAPDWMEQNRRNLLYISKSTFNSHLLSSEESLKNLYDFKSYISIPKFLNSLCHRKLAEEAIKIQGLLFLPPCPDYSSAVGILRTVKKYIFIDEPLVIDGKFPVSIGASQRFGGRASKEFFSEFKENADFSNQNELSILTVSIFIAQSLEIMRKFYPEFTVNKKNLICGSINDIIIQKSNGVNIKEAWKTLNDYLSRQPMEIRKAAAKQKIRSNIMLMLKKFRHIPLWEYLEYFRGIYVFRGSRWGFNNIQECGENAPKFIEKIKGKTRA